MTENKRFIMEESEGQDTIYDNEGLDDCYHLGNDTRDVKALCDLLNSLSEELYIAENEIARLELINDKLKKEDYSNYINHIKKLRDENEQLKKELDSYKPVIFESESSKDGYVTLYEKKR